MLPSEGAFAFASGNEGLWMIDTILNEVVVGLTLGQAPDGIAFYRRSVTVAGGAP